MMAAMSQNSCESSFFMWILSTDEPKDFRRTVTISVFQFRGGSFNINFFEISCSEGLTDQPVKLHSLLFAGTSVGGNVGQSLLQGIVVLHRLINVVAVLLNHPSVGGNVLAEAIVAPSFNPLHREVDGEGTKVNNVVVVFHISRCVECGPRCFRFRHGSLQACTPSRYSSHTHGIGS